MPFYFANPRNDPAPHAGNSSGRTEYIRSPPSVVLLFVSQIIGTWWWSWILASLPAVAVLFESARVNGKNTPVIPARLTNYTVAVPFASSIPLRLPKLAIFFDGDRVNNEDREKVETAGGTELRLGRKQKKAFLIDFPDTETYRMALSLRSLDDAAWAPNFAISASRITDFSDIVTAVNNVGATLFQLFSMEKGGMGLVQANMWKDLKQPGVVNQGIEEGQLEVSEVDVEAGMEVEITVMGSIPTAVGSLALAKDTKLPSKQWYGDSAETKHVIGKSSGLFMPYEVNYSAPDPTVIMTFFQLFAGFFPGNSFSSLSTFWVKEMMSTSAGQTLAHLMVALIISYRAHKPVYAIVESGVYHGVCLIGTVSLELTGRFISELKNAELLEDIDTYKFHLSTLARILRVAGVTTVTAQDVTSMRHLRELVIPGMYLPSGQVVEQIRKLLPFCSFQHTPLAITVSSFEYLQPLLTTDVVLPRDLFLHHTSFFSLNRLELILSAFGENIPDFSIGTQGHQVSPVVSARGSNATVKYRAEPPLHLQCSRVSMTTAFGHWKSMLEHGVTLLETQRKVQGARSFNGREKVAVWSVLSSIVSASVRKEGGISTMSDVPDKGKKRDRDDVGPDAEEKEKGAKKKRTAGLF